MATAGKGKSISSDEAPDNKRCSKTKTFPERGATHYNNKNKVSKYEALVTLSLDEIDDGRTCFYYQAPVCTEAWIYVKRCCSESFRSLSPLGAAATVPTLSLRTL